MITGRRAEVPFQLELQASAAGLMHQTLDTHSTMFTFVKADYIVYIRPDLQIVTLGK
jgi:hypothetical protein